MPDAAPVPDITGDYKEASFDKDVGRLYTRYTITQDGLRITMQHSRDEWDGSVVRYDGTGAIEKVYDDRPLVRLRFDDHTRRYFDLRERKLVEVEDLFQIVVLPGLDFRDEAQVRQILRVLGAMSAVLGGEPKPPAVSYDNGCWPPPREAGIVSAYEFALGPSGGPQFDFQLFFDADGMPNSSHIALQPLHDAQSVYLHYEPREPPQPIACYGARALPEHHAALRSVVAAHCTLEDS